MCESESESESERARARARERERERLDEGEAHLQSKTTPKEIMRQRTSAPAGSTEKSARTRMSASRSSAPSTHRLRPRRRRNGARGPCRETMRIHEQQ